MAGPVPRVFRGGEHLPVGTYKTKGEFYYDATNNRYRVDRENGRGDRYCWLNGLKVFSNTPCSHIVSEGKRYLHYPEKKSCCYCCNAAQGCGILKPTWLTGADFKGEVNIDGQQAYLWDQHGLQPNLYYETIAENPLDRKQIETFQGSNDKQVFDTTTFSKSLPNDHMALPDECEAASACSYASVCSAVRMKADGFWALFD